MFIISNGQRGAQVDLLFVIVSCLSSAMGRGVAQVDLVFVIVSCLSSAMGRGVLKLIFFL